MTPASTRAFAARLLLASALVTIALPALAQGNKNNTPAGSHGQTNGPTAPGRGAHGPGSLPLGGRTTGVWLDDASVLAPGSSTLAISWDNWASPLGSQQFFPATSVSLGVSNRVQAEASVPVMFSGHGNGPAASVNVGDVYVGAKIALMPPAGRVGLAVTPTLEILGSQSVGADASRAHWVLPVSVELRGDPVRVYATTGYFSRGAWFVGGALDAQVTSRLALVGTLTQTHPVGAQVLADGTTAGAQLDAGAGAYVSITDRFTVFGSFSRTLSALQADSTKRLVSVGVAVSLSKGRVATAK